MYCWNRGFIFSTIVLIVLILTSYLGLIVLLYYKSFTLEPFHADFHDLQVWEHLALQLRLKLNDKKQTKQKKNPTAMFNKFIWIILNC